MDDPRLRARRTSTRTLAIVAAAALIAIAVAGIVIAVPALVALKVAAEHSERGSPLVAFLSPSSTRGFKTRHSADKPKS